MTAQIGERVARTRSKRDMTVQALADRCAEIGLPIGRVTITKLERGMRQAVTPAEVMVLAAALDVAPVELLFPVGIDKRIEILPGQMMDSLAAVRWFCGDLKLEVSGGVVKALRRPETGEESGVVLLEKHDNIARRWNGWRPTATQALRAAMSVPVRKRNREEIADWKTVIEVYRENASEGLRYIRAEMRRRGMTLPPVPLGLIPDDDDPQKPTDD
jgi:transcriptional regulator with XRE-family HTH domain